MPDHDEEPGEELVEDSLELPGSGEPAPAGEEPAEEEPASTVKADWRARIRRSGFGQVAVLLTASFAIAIAAWWAVKPSDSEDPQAET